jgi:hypothetical protein
MAFARAIASKSASGPAALSTASSASLNGLLLGRPPGLPDWPFLNPPLPVGFPGFRILQQACSQVYLRRDRGLLLQRRILLPPGPAGMVTVHCRHASVAAHERRLTRLPERMPLYMTICGNHLASRTPRGHRAGLTRTVVRCGFHGGMSTGPKTEVNVAARSPIDLAAVRVLRARPPDCAWERRAVGEGVMSCPRAGCGKSACPDRKCRTFEAFPRVPPEAPARWKHRPGQRHERAANEDDPRLHPPAGHLWRPTTPLVACGPEFSPDRYRKIRARRVLPLHRHRTARPCPRPCSCAATR